MNRSSDNTIFDHFVSEFERTTASSGERRVGSELKFPLVDEAGCAVPRETVDALWAHLVAQGWAPDINEADGRLVGARKAGEQNETVASCETGYCKTEFSLAHAADIHGLQRTLDAVVSDLRPFLDRYGVHLLCYGIHPVTPPSSDLLMKKMRASFWDKALPSNEVIAPEDGDDVHLFTVNACSHVHVSVDPGEAVQAVNLLNGLAGPQISLTANSNRTGGSWADARPYKSINEKLWDWWEPVRGRVGVPEAAFRDLKHYVSHISHLRPIYVKRDGQPILLTRQYEHFTDYFNDADAAGETVEGERYPLTPEMSDVSVHNSCYWYTSRISRYFTVENRIFDQQPRDALLAPAALTLGLLSNATAAWDAFGRHEWNDLREMRERACRHGLAWSFKGTDAADLARQMLELAEQGLRKRDAGEEEYLEPLRARLRTGQCPADRVAAVPAAQWPTQLLKEQSL